MTADMHGLECLVEAGQLEAREVVIITGSRALSPLHGGTTNSKLWAQEILAGIIASLDPVRAHVVHGGCPNSPDVWAAMLAQEFGVDSIEYSLDGGYYPTFAHDSRIGMWADDEELSSKGTGVWPLLRNKAMVARGVAYRKCGHRVRVVALRAPWSKTGGTAHTARVAVAGGLTVTNLTCPTSMRGRIKVAR